MTGWGVSGFTSVEFAPTKPQTLRAVATDGHRLAQVDLELPKGAAGIPGVIVPRKTVGEVQRLIEDANAEIGVELSAG